MKITKKYFFICLLSTLLISNIALAKDYQADQGYSGAYNISKGKGITIAVIDAGIWQEHPDLTHSTWINQKEINQNGIDDDNNGYIDDYYGWNFIDNNSNMAPKENHATNIAGIIAAQPDNGIGVSGIAPEAKLMSLIACDKSGCSRDAVIKAIKYATDNGAKIINLSLGGRGYVGYGSEYDEAIKYAYSHDVVIVASAGNGDVSSLQQIGQNLNFIKASPICNEPDDINMILGVGATKKNSNDKTSWSNYGDKYVDVWASGEDLTSTTVPLFSDGYGYETGLDGTSFSAPIISASAAVLMSSNPKLKTYEIINLIKNTNPFNINTLLTNTIHTSPCSISYFYKEISNGETILLNSKNLNSNIKYSLKNKTTNKTTNLDINNIEVLDANKFKINTSKLNLEEGTYILQTDNCQSEVSFSIKGAPKITTSNSDIKTIKPFNQMTREELISFLLDFIAKKYGISKS